MNNRFKTKRGRGPTCYRFHKTINGEKVFSSDFYRRIKRGNKYFYFKLGPEKRLAEIISNEIDDFLRDPRNSIDEAVNKFNPDVKYRKKNTAPIGTLIRIHEEIESSLELMAGTGKNYRTRLMWAIRRVKYFRANRPFPKMLSYKNALAEVENFPIHDLNERFLSDLKLAEMKQAGDSPLEQNKVKRRLKSAMSDARSVFSEPAIREYGNRGIEIPNLDGFLKSKLFQRISKTTYRLPSMDVIQKIFADFYELEQDKDAYRMFLLAVGGGLRRKEIVNLKWEWVTPGELNNAAKVILPVTDTFEQKGHGESDSELCDWAYRLLRESATSGEGSVIEGDKKAVDVSARHLAGWLRGKGLDRTKPVHELRMLYGSWVANRRGLYTAQKLLRHKDAQVTSDCYADLIPDEKVLVLWEPIKAAS